MKLTTIPDEEWATVEDAAIKFWDEIASESETKTKVVNIFKKYNADMQKAGRPLIATNKLLPVVCEAYCYASQFLKRKTTSTPQLTLSPIGSGNCLAG